MVNLTTAEIVRVFHGKRAKKGNWRAICPVHGGKYTGPLSINEHPDRSTGLYCFGGCDVRDILASKGLTLGDLYADKRTMTPEIRRQMADEDRLKLKARQHGLAIMAQAALPGERNYWRVVERNLAVEIRRLRDTIYPSEKKDRERAETIQRVIREYGFEYLWDCLPMARLQARMMNERKHERNPID